MKVRWSWFVPAAIGSILFACSGGEGGDSSSTSESSSSSSASSSSGGGSGGGSGGSTSSGMGGGSASSSSGGGMGGGSASSSSSSSSGSVYATCGDCTDLTNGAPSKECKAANDACAANADCAKVNACAFNCSSGDACCVIACFSGAPQAAIDLFKVYDGCIYCQTCKALCAADFGLDAYCKQFEPGAPACP